MRPKQCVRKENMRGEGSKGEAQGRWMVVLGRRLLIVPFVLDALPTFSVLQNFAKNNIIWVIHPKWVFKHFLCLF